MTTKETLQRGLDTLRTKGWCQGEYVDGNGSVCLYGALGVRRGNAPEVGDAVTAIATANLLVRWTLDEWNDAPERTQEEVEAAFEKAIASLP